MNLHSEDRRPSKVRGPFKDMHPNTRGQLLRGTRQRDGGKLV